MNGSPLQFALRELRTGFSNPRTLGVLLVAVVALALAGPFGTFAQLSTAARFGYWAAVALATYAVAMVFGMLALDAARRHTQSRPLLTLTLALASCVPVALTVTAINLAILGEAWPDLAGFLELVLNCFFITLGIAVIVVLTNPRARETPLQSAAVPPPPPQPVAPAILKRLPLPQRGALSHLSMQDHYVDVVTDRGHALILMRLSDAIVETAPVAGLQIHRSHWIALDAVRAVVKGDGKAIIEMSDGTRLPVSRSYLPAARDAGLLL